MVVRPLGRRELQIQAVAVVVVVVLLLAVQAVQA
jgi:hypothetical protein